MIKVMVLINQLGYGGAPKLIYDFANNIDKNNFKIIVGMLGGRNCLLKDFQEIGIEVVDFSAKGKFDLGALFNLFQYLKHKKPDILHTHLPYSHIVGRLTGRIAGVKNIVSTLQNVYKSQHIATRLIDRWTTPLSDIVTAVSLGVEESYFSNSDLFTADLLLKGKRHYTIYNAIDIKKIDAAITPITSLGKEFKLAELNLNREPFRLVCAARLHPNKGHRYLIEAIKILESDKRYAGNIKLLLLGDGKLEENLRKQVEDLELEHCIELLGYREDVYEIFSVADAFILPSINEGLPVVLIEAMAAKLPIISTQIPGIQEIVKHERNGLLVPPADPEMLANAIEKLLVDPERFKAYGANGRFEVETKFSIESITKQYEEIYYCLMNF